MRGESLSFLLFACCHIAILEFSKANCSCSQLRYSQAELIQGQAIKAAVQGEEVKRNPEMGKLPYSLCLPKQPIHPFPGYF